MEGSIPILKDTYDKLCEELDHLKKNERPEIIEAISVARANGDLKENADYHAAREKQGIIEDRIRYVEDRIARSVIIENIPSESPHIIFGAKVTIKNLATQKEVSYTLVSTDAVNPAEGKISSTSPIGKALIGKKTGDIVDVQTPRGVNQFEILGYC
jgi:transcription elongation factor GreA